MKFPTMVRRARGGGGDERQEKAREFSGEVSCSSAKLKG